MKEKIIEMHLNRVFARPDVMKVVPFCKNGEKTLRFGLPEHLNQNMSYLATAIKARSTFKPVLALVSINATL